MPLRQEFCPKPTLYWDSPSTLSLQLTPAQTPLVRQQLNCVVIGQLEDVTQLSNVAGHSTHAIALLTNAGYLHRNFVGEIASIRPAAPDYLRAITLARTMLSQSRQGTARRIVLIGNEGLSFRLELEALTGLLLQEGIALDVITSNGDGLAWSELLAQTCGRYWLGESLVSSLNEYLAAWQRIAFEGAEVRVQGLVGIGKTWRAGQVTVAPLAPDERHYLRFHRPVLSRETPRVEIRYLGLGYTVILSVPTFQPRKVG